MSQGKSIGVFLFAVLAFGSLAASASALIPDTQAPQTTITSGPSAPIAGNSATFTFISSEAGTFQCRLDSVAEEDWSACDSPQTYTGLADGPHSFEVRATDQAGNTDPTPAGAAFNVYTTPAPVYTGPPPVYTGPPPPIAGVSFNVEPAGGTVELQCPGEDSYSKLSGFKQIPVGCLVNTRRGTVSLTASKGASGDLQSGHFWGGVFVVSQEIGDDQDVVMKLVGRRMCERKRSSGKKRVRVLRRKRGGGRRLWGSGKGSFKTAGSHGAATVRGTTWLVVDRCDGSTLFKVGEGTVWVRDFVKRKSFTLETGETYVAKPPIPRLRLRR